MPKILVVDDSALMRILLRDVLEKAGFTVASAQNGKECLDKIPTFNPDAITLDINMPVMNGMTCLSAIMKTNPKPVIMVSSLSREGAEATIKALEIGAIDFFPKPTQSLALRPELLLSLVQKLKTAVNTNVSRLPMVRRNRQQLPLNAHSPSPTRSLFIQATKKRSLSLIVIGVSTGGPSCLQQILKDLPENFTVPIVIAQHMPARFTEVLSQRLNKLIKQVVTELTTLCELQAGHIYVAKGDADVQICKRGTKLFAASVESNKQYSWHPSVSCLVDSALKVINPENLLCIQLTGMGNDGALSMFTAHQKGAYCIAESSDTAIVYGMPQELVKLGGADQILPNYKIAEAIVNLIA